MSEGLRMGAMVGQAQRRNPTSSSEVVGQIVYHSPADDAVGAVRSDVVGLCTLDGETSSLPSFCASFLLPPSPSLPLSSLLPSQVVNHNIPYGDTFYTVCRYCVTRVAHKKTRLRVTANIKFKKSCWGLVKS